jgi:hypothetical protein
MRRVDLSSLGGGAALDVTFLLLANRTQQIDYRTTDLCMLDAEESFVQLETSSTSFPPPTLPRRQSAIRPPGMNKPVGKKFSMRGQMAASGPQLSTYTWLVAS